MLHIVRQNLRSIHFALFYLLFFIAAEAVSLLLGTESGLIAYALAMCVLFIHVSTTRQVANSRFALSLTLLPIARMMGLLLPYVDLPPLIWLSTTGIVLFTIAVLIVRMLNLSWRSVGLYLQDFSLQLMGILIGLIFGLLEYLLLQPAPIWSLSTSNTTIISVFLALLAIGISLELVFHGIMQTTAVDILGRFGIIYIASLFALFHFGLISTDQNILSVFLALGIGLIFGWLVYKSASMIGVGLAHGLRYAMLFLIMPLLFAQGLLPVWLAPEAIIQIDTLSGFAVQSNLVRVALASEEPKSGLEQQSPTATVRPDQLTASPTVIPQRQNTSTVTAPSFDISSTLSSTMTVTQTASPTLTLSLGDVITSFGNLATLKPAAQGNVTETLLLSQLSAIPTSAQNPEIETPIPTETPTATVEATHTSTSTSTLAPTETPVPTETPTPTVEATHTSTPTSTLAPTETPVPTETPTPTVEATHTSTSTSTLTPTEIPTSTPSPTPEPPIVLIAPTDGVSSLSDLEFQWVTTLNLASDQQLELVFWQAGEDPLRDGVGVLLAPNTQKITIQLNKLDIILGDRFEPGNYQWGLLLAQTNPDYVRLGLVSDIRGLTYR